MKRWWVVTYKTRELNDIEHVILSNNLDIDIYVPMVKVSKTIKGISKVVKKPLLFNYMFIRFDIEVLPLQYVRSIIHIRPLYVSGIFRYVSDNEINRLKMIERSYDYNFNRLRSDINYLKRYIGTTVLVRDGVFTGLVGKIVDVIHTGSVIVELMIFQRLISCELLVEAIEFVKT